MVMESDGTIRKKIHLRLKQIQVEPFSFCQLRSIHHFCQNDDMMALGGRNLEPAGINKKYPWFFEASFLSLEAQTASSKSHTLPKLNMEAKMMLVKFGSSPIPFGAIFR